MTTPNIPALLTDLAHATAAANGVKPCPLCQYIANLPSGPVQDAMRDAAAGTIGVHKLEAILRKHKARDDNDKPVGRRSITRHRKEDHQP